MDRRRLLLAEVTIYDGAMFHKAAGLLKRWALGHALFDVFRQVLGHELYPDLHQTFHRERASLGFSCIPVFGAPRP